MANTPMDLEWKRQEEEAAVEAIIVELRVQLWDYVARGGSLADLGPIENIADVFDR